MRKLESYVVVVTLFPLVPNAIGVSVQFMVRVRVSVQFMVRVKSQSAVYGKQILYQTAQGHRLTPSAQIILDNGSTYEQCVSYIITVIDTLSDASVSIKVIIATNSEERRQRLMSSRHFILETGIINLDALSIFELKKKKK